MFGAIIVSLVLLILFVLLTPGVLLTLPKKGSKITVAFVHGLVFAIIFYILYIYVIKRIFMLSFENFKVVKEGEPCNDGNQHYHWNGSFFQCM